MRVCMRAPSSRIWHCCHGRTEERAAAAAAASSRGCKPGAGCSTPLRVGEPPVGVREGSREGEGDSGRFLGALLCGCTAVAGSLISSKPSCNADHQRIHKIGHPISLISKPKLTFKRSKIVVKFQSISKRPENLDVLDHCLCIVVALYLHAFPGCGIQWTCWYCPFNDFC